MQHGLLMGKTVHATPEVIRSLEDKMPAYGIKKDDLRRPAFHRLTGDTYEVRVSKLHAALNVSDVSDAHRQAIMEQLRTVYPREQLDADLLIDQKKLGKFIESKHGNAYDSIKNFLDSFQHKLADDHPLKAYKSLKGEGWLHIKDKDGKKTRLSVNYARNATPHSARTTPFFVHGHYDDKWIGSYLNPGDARYGSHNADNYKGPEIDTDHLNKKFFAESNQRLVQELPDLKDKDRIAASGPTYFDMDVTSITKKGWAPTEHQVENNLSDISAWFKDKGMLLAMISTNDNRFETALRVGTRVHRDITVFGSNLEKTKTTLNVLGVNDLRHEPDEDGNNIQLYLDKIFEERLQKKIANHHNELANATVEANKQKIEEKIARHEARLIAFQELKGIGHASARYKRRIELEVEMEQRFGHGKATLGSLIESDETGLGTIHVGRTSDTAMGIHGMDDNPKILPGPDGRRLVLLTGTQGTNVEVDSALSALSKGHHSSLDGNPKNNRNARPIIPENNVIVISQTAIPGNGDKQNELVRNLVKRGFTVVQAMHDKFKIHNIDPNRRKNIIFAVKLKSLRQSIGSNAYTPAQRNTVYEAIKNLMPDGYTGLGDPLEHSNFIEYLQTRYTREADPFGSFLADASNNISDTQHRFKKETNDKYEDICKPPEVEDNSLEVYGMPIHAGGHGHRKDCEAWIKLVKADVTAAQHTSDPEAGLDLDDLCKKLDRKYMGRIVPNFEGLSIKAGDGTKLTDIHSIGKMPESHIRIEINRKKKQYHGGHMKAWRVVKDEPGLRSDGLGATTQPGGWYKTAFANIDAEQDTKETVERAPIDTDPVPENTQWPVDHHRWQGALNPANRKSELRSLRPREPLPSAGFSGAGR